MLVYINPESFQYPHSLPEQVQPVLKPNEWVRICQSLSNVRWEATLGACCCEIAIFLLTGFFCIFCCHTCFVSSNEEPLLSRKISNLNYELFNGRPVLSRYQQGILVNTELIPNHNIAIAVVSSSIPIAPVVVAQHLPQEAVAVPANP